MFTDLVLDLPHLVAGIMVLSLTAYVLLGGADFGGGVWDLLAHGDAREAQRALIAEAIGPIWEANHVWLILVVVLLFTCFPTAFAHLSTVLHIPITLMLIGVTLRGSAFTFRTYDSSQDVVQRRWGRLFSIASVLTPLLLGLCFGAVAGGRVPMAAPTGADFAARYVWPWLASGFAWAVGGLTLSLFAYLAAVYLTVEAHTEALQSVFRRGALQAQGAVLCMAALTVLLAKSQAPFIYTGLTEGAAALTMHAITAIAALTAIATLWTRRFVAARAAAAVQASCILWGWAWSQFPWLIPPTRSITALAAPHVTLRLVLTVLGIGTAILLPSFVYLFRVFKSGETAFEQD